MEKKVNIRKNFSTGLRLHEIDIKENATRSMHGKVVFYNGYMYNTNLYVLFRNKISECSTIEPEVEEKLNLSYITTTEYKLLLKANSFIVDGNTIRMSDKDGLVFGSIELKRFTMDGSSGEKFPKTMVDEFDRILKKFKPDGNEVYFSADRLNDIKNGLFGDGYRIISGENDINVVYGTWTGYNQTDFIGIVMGMKKG